MKKILPKGKIRCGICNKIFPSKSPEANEHFKSKEHLKKMKKVEEAYKASLDSLTNFKDL